jgi:hypothetical protein
MADGFDWRELLKIAGPAIGSIASGGGGADAAFMHSFQQTQARIEQEKHQQAQVAQRDSEMGSQYALKAFEQLQNLTDPDEFAQALNVFETNAPKGMKPGALTGARFSDSKALVARQKKAQQKLDALVKVHGPDVLDADVVVDFEGKPLPLQDLLKLSELTAADPAGKPYKPPKKADANASTDYGRYLAKFAKDQGKTVDKLTGADELAARKSFNTVDDKPPAPIDQGMRDATLTLKELQADALRIRNSKPPDVGLKPAVQRQANIKADQFAAHPTTKRTNIMAEAVTFVNGMNLNTRNPADDQALIYAFAKAMDPDSVVREGEYATVQKYAQSWLSSFGFDAMRVLSSNVPILTAQSRANLKATINAKYQATRGQYDSLKKQYGAQINRITGGTDGDTWLVDPLSSSVDDGPSAPVEEWARDKSGKLVRKR